MCEPLTFSSFISRKFGNENDFLNRITLKEKQP